jgi:hypothetical protein
MLASPTCSDGNENKNVRLDACVFFHAKRNAEKPKWAKPFNVIEPCLPVAYRQAYFFF